MKVYCYPVARESTYVPLIFTGIVDEYRPVYREDGSLLDAIRDIDAGTAAIVHIHWEEFVLRDCRSPAQAREAAEAFCAQIVALRRRNARIVWTVHNELPHLIPFRSEFLTMRDALARNADTILVHNETSIGVLAAQVACDVSRVRLLAHPSYLGVHENESSLQAGLLDPPGRQIQGFGWIRLQKGFGDLIDALPPDFLRSRDTWIRISGEGPEAAAVIAPHAHRSDVEWDIRHVPSAEVPALLRSAACLVLPYERVLTSGVALLAMSVGALLVAIDIPQLRDLVPAENHRFLYARGDGAALRRCIDDVLALTAHEREKAIAANLAAARSVHPSIIARRLAAIYDETERARR